MFNLDFRGKIALVTGASRGIGKAIADDLKACGAKVVTLSSKDVDLSNIKELKDYMNLLMIKLDRIDILINNAGINKVNTLTNIDDDEYDNIMDVNLKAPFIICREISKFMRINNYGRIVNISSIAADRVREGRTVYSTSKHALIGLTKNIALDLANYNILANCVSPGFTLTEMTSSILPDSEAKSLASQVPLKRFALPSEISKAVLFLASDLNTYITAQNLIVDGGYVNAVNA